MIARGRTGMALSVALVCALLAGCSDDEPAGEGPSPSASSSSPTPLSSVPPGFDACTLFTTAEVEGLTDQDVTAGKKVIAALNPPPGIGELVRCDWEPSGGSALPLFSVSVGSVTDLTKATKYYDDLAAASLGTVERGIGLKAVSTSVEKTFSMSAINEKVYVVALCQTAGGGTEQEHNKRNRDTCSVPAVEKVLSRFR